MDLVEATYKATRRFPHEELYCLKSQLRRAAISVPCNIAEGQGRRSPREFIQFLSVAYGSLREVETHILIARRLDYLDEPSSQQVLAIAAELGRLLNGLSTSLDR
jgi:four helix bundle protein